MRKDPQGSECTGVTFEAKIAPNGQPFIQGLLQGNLPAGIKFIGNGTCPHPLNVQLSGVYAITPQLYRFAQDYLKLYKKHLEGDEEFTDFNEQELAAEMAVLEQVLAGVTAPTISPAESLLAELLDNDLLACSCEADCDGQCHRAKANRILARNQAD